MNTRVSARRRQLHLSTSFVTESPRLTPFYDFLHSLQSLGACDGKIRISCALLPWESQFGSLSLARFGWLAQARRGKHA
uniref:Uncharacterized protein n=1 Tax=Arundo donax TaxID=35708 RepID=A0A0A9GS46_ARUDO